MSISTGVCVAVIRAAIANSYAVAEQSTPGKYTWHPGIRCDDLIQHFPANLGKALEYIYRCMCCSNPLFDIESAIYFLEKEHQRIQKYGNDIIAGSFEASNDRDIALEALDNISPLPDGKKRLKTPITE